MARRSKIKKHTASKIIIAVVVILLIVAIALGIFYAVAPEEFNALKEKLFPSEPSSPGTKPTLEGTLEMTVIDIGQGDCIFLQFPDGQTMIMDAGSTKGGSYTSIQEHLALRAVEYLDYVFITHTDQDHIKYLPDLFKEYDVRNVYMPYLQEGDITTDIWTETYEAIQNETYIDEEGNIANCQVHYNVGDYVVSGKDWEMNCHSYLEDHYPPVKDSSSSEVKNAVSPVCFLEYADRTIVLTGDSNESNEEYLLERGVLDKDADVLKVGHHGSRTSTIQEFLNAVDCEYAIVSYGEGNKYKHPHSELNF